MSILTTLKEKLQNATKNSKLFKKIANLTLAGAITISMVGLISCTGSCSCFGTFCTSYPQTDNENNNNNNNNNNNGNDNGNENNNNSQYTPILQTVLTDSRYDDASTNNPLYKGLPYNVLKSYNVNINKLQQENIFKALYRKIYFKNGSTSQLNIYINFEFENEVISLIASYNVTQKEYNEFKMLADGKYIQSLAWLTELDNPKTPSSTSFIKYEPEDYYDLYARYTTGYKENIQFHILNIEPVYPLEGDAYYHGTAAVLGSSTIHYREFTIEMSSRDTYINNKLTLSSKNSLYDITSTEMANTVDVMKYYYLNSVPNQLEKN